MEVWRGEGRRVKELSSEACWIFLNPASGRKRKFVCCKTLGIFERGVRYMRLWRKIGKVLNTSFRLRRLGLKWGVRMFIRFPFAFAFGL